MQQLQWCCPSPATHPGWGDGNGSSPQSLPSTRHQPPTTQTLPQLPWGQQDTAAPRGQGLYSERSLGPPWPHLCSRYRHQGAFMGAAAPGGACQRDAAATVALVGSLLSPACPSPAHTAVNPALGSSSTGHRSGISAGNAQLCQPISVPPVPRERHPGVLLCPPGTGAGPQPGHELGQPPRLQLPRACVHHEP